MNLVHYVDVRFAAVLLGLGVLAAAARPARGPAARRRRARVALATYGAVALVLGLSGGTPGRHALNLVPLRTVLAEAHNPDTGLLVVNLAGNVLFFVPLGVLLLAATRWRPAVAAVVGTACCVVLEAVQYGVGRTADVDDVLLNAVGVGLGVLAVVARRARAERRTAPRCPGDDDARRGDAVPARSR